MATRKLVLFVLAACTKITAAIPSGRDTNDLASRIDPHLAYVTYFAAHTSANASVSQCTMVCSWATSVRRAVGEFCSVILLTDQISGFELPCLHLRVEVFRAPVNKSLINLAKFNAYEHFLRQVSEPINIVAMDTDMLLLRDLSFRFNKDFDLGLTWTRPSVPSKHFKYMPVNAGIMYISGRGQVGEKIFQHLAELFLQHHAEDLWWGDQLVLRRILGRRRIPDRITTTFQVQYAKSGDPKQFHLCFFPAAFDNHNPPLKLTQKRVNVVHFKGATKHLMGSYLKKIVSGRPLPMAPQFAIRKFRTSG
ncbi:hypothetical protein CYMTET_37594 [Cymbomonas tetramitiformis]|uniref:Nucleotide-diphospho-sugar transferase domain-containing protein n=1 Tax=Cymbomonas tetramitiformis TaxID=36881 RepID=A0AAE0CFZ7_9CHLO|nr:hypothetical protein CYMTET_37594 [Cymbomonas tetramitiformis]